MPLSTARQLAAAGIADYTAQDRRGTKRLDHASGEMKPDDEDGQS